MPAFQFPDPAVEQTVINTLTGSTYQWREDPGKWVITAKSRDVGEIIWEGDNEPNPNPGDYKLWYHTDKLELYFWYEDVNGVGAWVPTSAPITMLEDLDAAVAELKSDVVQINTATQTNENRIETFIAFSETAPPTYPDAIEPVFDTAGNPLLDENGEQVVTYTPDPANHKFWINTNTNELHILRLQDEDLRTYEYELVAAGSEIWFGENPPPEERYELWFDTTRLELLVKYNDQWWPVSIPADQMEELRVYFEKVIGELATDISKLETTLAVSVNNVKQEIEYVHVYVGDNPPALINEDINQAEQPYQLWFDTQRHELCVYVDGYWFPANAGSSGDSGGETPNLEKVLTAGNLADKDMILTNGADDVIGISPTEARIALATSGNKIPKFELAHSTGGSGGNSKVELELDENGKRFDIECEERVDNIHFRFGNIEKFIINKSGDAQFLGRVKAEKAIEDDELVTYEQLVDLEQEIESISPSVERGEWTYTNDYHLDRLQPGQYISAVIQNQVDHDAEISLITAQYYECYNAAMGDEEKVKECGRIYTDALDAVTEVGSPKPTPDFTKITHLVFHNNDDKGVLHTFDDAKVGQHISLLDEEDDDFLIGIIKDIDTTDEDDTIIEITLVQALGEADPTSKVRIRIFEVESTVDVTEFVKKSGDTMTGPLKLAEVTDASTDDTAVTKKYLLEKIAELEARLSP